MAIRNRPAGTPAVFSAAEILISAAKKLVSKAELIMSALEIGVSVAEITVSTTEIIASLISIMMCSPDMTVDGIEIIFNDTQLIVFVISGKCPIYE